MAARIPVNETGFTTLHEAPDPVVDIVFVHGFTGHPRDTWAMRSEKPKKPVRADDQAQSTRRSKIPRLPFLSRGPSVPASPTSSTWDSARSSATGKSGGWDKHNDEAEGQRQKDVYWPADLACQTVPNSRILTYGYDTKIRHWVAGPVSKNTVYDHAWDLLCCLEAQRRNANERQRPILFIAHSLGGIVVKEALRRSRACQSSKPHLFTILEATHGLIFFGTPHGGSDPRSSLHHVLSASAQVFGVQVNQQIVSTLMPDSTPLTELRDDFAAIWEERRWQVYSFQEQYGIASLFGRKVVDDGSSCLSNFTLETRQHIARNHMDMCRFHGLQDPQYSKVAAAMNHILETLERRPVELNPGKFAGPGSPTVMNDAEDGECCDHNPRSPSPTEVRQWTEDMPQDNQHTGLSEEMRKSLIRQLYFSKIDERLTSLTAAQEKTCRWFLAKPEYASWRDPEQRPDHGGFLWIKGKPGTGKSTLMKFLFEEAKLGSKGNPLQLVLSFFFLARGSDEEKSTTGLYRSLLHQLFEKAKDLQDSLEWMTIDGARGIKEKGWNEEALKQTFRDAVRRLNRRSLTIFVDALDECEDNEARNMIFFFEELCDLAQERHLGLLICFSSRHYPHVEITKGIELTLEDELGHKADIEHYIKTKLRLRKSPAAESLQLEILEKSSLIFLWVVLVVEILNSEYPGKPIDRMRQRLKDIPPGLAALFELILSRDQENQGLLRLCLQWILFAIRPLKPEELYCAVQFGLKEEEGYSGYCDPEVLDSESLEAFVRHASKGFAEVTRNDSSEVQFIHESVRDFLFGKYEKQWSVVQDGNFRGQSHEVLRDCCLSQLVTPDERIPKLSTAQSTTSRVDLKLNFPFLGYASRFILGHMQHAFYFGLDQVGFLDRFPFPRWEEIAIYVAEHPSCKSIACFSARGRLESERYRIAIYSFVRTVAIGEQRAQPLVSWNPQSNKPCPVIGEEISPERHQMFVNIQGHCCCRGRRGTYRLVHTTFRPPFRTHRTCGVWFIREPQQPAPTLYDIEGVNAPS